MPPIIFYAGLSVKKKHFFRNFFTIVGYGVVGTYTCFAIISLGLFVFLRSYLSFGVGGRWNGQGVQGPIALPTVPCRTYSLPPTLLSHV